MQDTTRPRWLKWTTYHLIVYVVMSDFNVSLAASPVLYTYSWFKYKATVSFTLRIQIGSGMY